MTQFSIITPTHKTTHLAEAYASLCALVGDATWEWIVLCNGGDRRKVQREVTALVGHDARVRILESRLSGIGALKHSAFMQGQGQWLIEFDHDDKLAPNALIVLADTIAKHPEAGFIYSDFADFEGQTYGNNIAAWMAGGWTFRTVDGVLVPNCFPPSAATLSSILWAPNHVRLWKREVYHALGGHDSTYTICDDYELLVRTYLETPMVHVPEVLYQYRIHQNNSWAPRAAEIAELSRNISSRHLESLVLREAALKGMPAIDLGSAKSPRIGWQGADILPGQAYTCDLTKTPWPWADNSVQAFRANDLLEHLPDKAVTVREIWRCLAPGGWLLSETPSTDGRGAFMDPSHVSYWNENSWWYWTRDEQAHFIDNTDIRFQVSALGTHFPSDWHKKHNICYVRANLWKPGPGFPRASV